MNTNYVSRAGWALGPMEIRTPASDSSRPYSPHAMEAFTDALGIELEPVGVQVSVIEPGNFNSDIANRSVYPAPDAVTDAVRHALFDTTSRRRYMVVSNEGEANYTISQQLRRLAQTNESQAFRYDRAKLIEMLDAAIAEEKAARRGM